MKKILLVFLTWSAASLNAQATQDSIPKKQKVRYIGIQANLLLQQFISFNSNSSINTNPYTFSFSKNDISTGRGFVFGTGFNASESSSNDGVVAVSRSQINFTFRFGMEKKYLQHQKFVPFWGIELGLGGLYNRVFSRFQQTFPTPGVLNERLRLFFGPSFRGGLNYALSKHVMIGTEFFFNVQVSTSLQNGQMESTTPFSIGFQAPTALFLIFRY